MANPFRWPTRRADPADGAAGPPSTRARGAGVESAARAHLQSAGLIPIAANANYRFGELDLVMRERDVLVFVEVRYRAGGRFGGGAESITRAKRRRLVQAASAFLASHPSLSNLACRFDVVEATGEPAAPQLTWWRDAFRADDA